MTNNIEHYPGQGLPKLRVRTGRAYYLPFTIDLGQRNASFLKRPLTPLRRVLPWTVAMAPVPEWDYDIIHSFNGVPSLTKRPYIITYESNLPRLPRMRISAWLYTWVMQHLLEKLLDEQCVSLLAMSEYARRRFRRQNQDFAGLEQLERKMEVLYPAVPLRRTDPKQPSGRLKLLFVGTAFMYKGGPALLRAHKRLKSLGVPVETTIVSSLQWSADDLIGPPSAEYVQQQLAELNQEGVVHYPGLPNADVMRLMQEADYFVFPTLNDTFGYAPIEALSCATPVLATNTCAQPEIVVDGQCGYLLPFENDENGFAWIGIKHKRQPDYLDVYDSTIERLGEAISDRLMSCWESRDGYEALSAGAIEQVRARFHKDQARHRLEQLYESCRQQ